MKEISGFGGGYEEACRRMVKAGCEWFDAHPNADPKYSDRKLCVTKDNEDAVELDKAIIGACPDCSGAMFGAARHHVWFIHKNGWDKYVSEMKK